MTAPTADHQHVPNPDPYRGLSIAMVALFILTLPGIIIAAILASPKPAGPPKMDVAESAIVNEAGGMQALIASDLYARGREEFIASCTACHGEHGEAKPYLGKDIAHSRFVAERTDDEMLAYIKVGRRVDDPLNTTGVDMPPKGGNPALDDAKIREIIAYIRALQATARGEIELPAG